MRQQIHYTGYFGNNFDFKVDDQFFCSDKNGDVNEYRIILIHPKYGLNLDWKPYCYHKNIVRTPEAFLKEFEILPYFDYNFWEDQLEYGDNESKLPKRTKPHYFELLGKAVKHCILAESRLSIINCFGSVENFEFAKKILNLYSAPFGGTTQVESVPIAHNELACKTFECKR